MEFISTDAAPVPGCYSQAVAVDAGNVTLLFLAGQTGNIPGVPDEPVIEGGLGPQTTQALKNIVATVEATGGTVFDLVELKIFLKDPVPEFTVWPEGRLRRESRELFGDAYRDFFSGFGRSREKNNLPARTMVWVSDVPLEYPTENTLVEITAVAVIPKK